MFINTQCAFCGQMFDYDSSSGEPVAECPHCGKSNTVELAGAPPPDLTVQHNAPTLAGVKTCPTCKAQIERDAVLCIHCGTNLTTGQKAGSPSWLATHGPLAGVVGVAVIIGAVAVGYLLWPEADVPALPDSALPVAPQPEPPVAPPPAHTEPKPTIMATTNESPELAEADATPPPPPKPTAAELAAEQAAQEAAAERAAFAQKKFAAEQQFRFQLDTREPLYVTNELMELRRRNGLLTKGTLIGFDGRGTNRVVLLTTPDGEASVPLIALDAPTRRRLDPDYREAFIQHVMSTRMPDPQTTPPEE